MSRKILAIVSALLIAASLCACGNKNKTGETETTPINVNNGGNNNGGSGNEYGSEVGTGSVAIGDPGEYTYVECDQTVYVNNPDSAVTLRSATYEAKGSVGHGTELRRIGLSNDGSNYWSKVVYDGETYYVASKFLTTISNPDEGFVAVDKTVVVNDKTGSLNIRNIPDINGSIVIGWAVAGVEIKVVAENTETNWYKVEFVPYGSTEKTYGYIKSGKDNFVQNPSETGTTTETGTTAETTANSGSTGK